VSDLALKLEGVSKLYRLGEVGTGSVSHDLNRWWASIRGKEDPMMSVGVENDRTEDGGDYVWALKDVEFELKQGEILGVIGRNGAGKSTLLKLLSRVTAPTQGRIFLNGKLASLLEVGTGFHPELTGRENIYLNGAILGMSRQEVRLRFDDIVEFSGCAKYIDTPVKRYSSGMYVRLAFAVAAHLEPDILVVDEVLAVGDAEFQAKCVGKLKNVSEESGRTVLFVSHNMASIKRLCPKAMLMSMGRVDSIGATADVIDRYLSTGAEVGRLLQWEEGEAPSSSEMKLTAIRVLDDKGRLGVSLVTGQQINIQVQYELFEPIKNFRIVMTLEDVEGNAVFSTSDYLYQGDSHIRLEGVYISHCYIPADLMTLGTYVATFDFEIPMERSVLPSVSLSFSLTELSHNQLGRIYAEKPPGVVHPKLTWEVNALA